MDEGEAPYWRYWGKADPQVGGFHLAALHSLDVAAVADRVLSFNAALTARFAVLTSIPRDDIAATLAAFVACHDLGKFDVRFQIKAPPGVILDAKREGVRSVRYDHGAWGYHQVRAVWDRDAAPLYGEASLSIFQAVCGHHGALPSKQQPPTDPPARAHRDQDAAARCAWLRDVHALFFERGAKLPFAGDVSMALVEMVAGLCAVADWIGSQTDYFKYRRDGAALSGYFVDALGVAERALSGIGIAPSKARGATFVDLFPGYTPRDVQEVVEAVSLPVAPALVVIEAQMGSGKTEAALSLAARWHARGDATGLYIALPTMATSNAMLRRIEAVAPLMFEGDVQLVLAHGRRRTHAGFQRLVGRSLVNRSGTTDEREATVMCARWFLSRKRVLLSQVGVGTIDQAMQAAIQVRHQFVRLFALSTSVVVIDEVHAYDAYMEVILERLVQWLGALHVPVVLLSATLPASRRRALVDAYRGDHEGGVVSFEDAQCTAYPLVTIASSAGVTEHQLGVAPASRPVTIELRHLDDPCAALLPEIIQAVRDGAMVAWVRNTVGDAQAAFHVAREASVDVELFHARLRGADRSAVEERVLERFGAIAERRGRLLIATQVVEQSLDVDFDLLVTDLAPIDLVLQRIGRLHRHKVLRPAGFEAPRCIVVAPTEAQVATLDFGGGGYVYDRATLWLSHASLSSTARLQLPVDIRPLVEATYHPGRRAERLRAAGMDKLLAAEAKVQDDIAARQGKAKRACVAPAGLDPSAFGALGDDEETVRALTRDGDSTTLLLVSWDGEDGRSIDGGDPWHLDPEAKDAWKLGHALFDEVISVPAYPWEHIERGARACGEGKAWDAWLRRFEAFIDEVGLGRLVAIPVRERDGVFKGWVETSKKTKRVAYAKDIGLWFPKETP